MTCGGASWAILRANRRIQLQSRTVVHSFSFTLIYPQPCSTIHPPVAIDHFERRVTCCAALSARALGNVSVAPGGRIYEITVYWQKNEHI